MSFPRYPKYKPSGVEWLGEVPEHWQMDRLKRSVASCKNGTWGDDAIGGQDDVVCVRVADFDRGRLQVDILNPTIRCVPVKDRAGRLLAKGDLLLEKSGGGETSPVGFVVRWAHSVPAVCSNFVARLEPAERMSSSYWCYAHAAAYAVGINTRSVKQTSGIQNLDSQQYLDEPFLFPPLAEQRAIATFLDRETAKIDALIAEQEKLIELLAEKRQAVISHAVTKGLNPTAPMKPSGVEWLGDVPAHWEVKLIKRLSAVLRGASPRPIDDPKYFDDEGEYSWVRIADVSASDGELLSTPQRLSNLGSSLSVKLEPGSLFVSIAGTVGKPCISRIKACIHDGFVYFPRLAIEADWLYRIFAAGLCYGGLGKLGTQLNLNTDTIGGIHVPLPPAAERRAIAALVDAETTKMEAFVAEAEKGIELLSERRSALISAAVTGQIDVRNAVPESAA